MLENRVFQTLTMAGHTVHLDRSTYTHALYWNDVRELPKDRELTRVGMPIEVPKLGRNLTVGDVLPERLALGVDENGEVLTQNDFRERYLNYLREFRTDQDVNIEPVPNVLDYLMKQLDPRRPPENGKAFYVDLGFDPLATGEAKDTGEWHPDGVKYQDWLKNNPQALMQSGPSENESRIKELTQLWQDGTITAETLAKRVAALGNPEPEAPADPAPAAEAAAESADASDQSWTKGRSGNVNSDLYTIYNEVNGNIEDVNIKDSADPEPAAAAEMSGRDSTPCGKTVKAGFVNQHMAKCGDDACKAERAGSD